MLANDNTIHPGSTCGTQQSLRVMYFRTMYISDRFKIMFCNFQPMFERMKHT